MQPMPRQVCIAPASAEHPRNDTASVLELGDGRLMVVYHEYVANAAGGSDFGTARIVGRVSADCGLTWSDARVLVDVEPGDLNVQAPALCRLPSGDILLICLRAHARDSSSMLLFRSRDEGQTFSYCCDIWTRSEGQWLQGGASSLVRLAGGRLLLPFHGGTGDQGRQHNTIRCFVSDDDGESWRLTDAVIDLPMRGAMEASVAELADGRLVMSIRTQLGSVFLCHSDDRAETWRLPQTSGLRAPESCTCLRRVPGTNDLVLFWNDSPYDPSHHHYGERTPLSVAMSRDGGQTWTRVGDLATGDAEYTNLDCTFLSTGKVVVTYMASRPAFNRGAIELCASVVDVSWLYPREDAAP